MDDERICAMFSHKMAAHLAGLGWIGKSCLLVTPQYGPRVRWTTVLTDYPFSMAGTPDGPALRQLRGMRQGMSRGAFTGRMFDQNEPREARFDAGKCDQYFKDWRKRAQDRCAVCASTSAHMAGTSSKEVKRRI